MDCLRLTNRTHRMRVAVALALALTVSWIGHSAQASYSGHNGRLAFGMVINGNPEIVTIAANSHALHQLTSNTAFDACAAYSPDGKSIAFCSNRSGAFEIWTMKENGKQQRQLTHIGSALFPDYAADGERVAFDAVSQVPNVTTRDIYAIDTDGTGLTALTADPANDALPAWSPDGTRIAFISNRSGVAQVWVMNADGSNPTQLTTDPAPKDQLPDWSPDGTKIVYQSGATGNGDIYVMNADGSGQTSLTTDPAFELAPTWSPDGTQIAFLRVNASDRPVYVMNADGTNAHAVLPGSAQFAPAWQPLGHRRR